MVWECSECGTLVEEQRPPSCCPACGLAVVFSLADDALDGDAGYMSSLWYEAALHPEQVALEEDLRRIPDGPLEMGQ